MLYMPWKDENKDLMGESDSYCNRYENVKTTIVDAMSQYDNCGDDLDDAEEAAQLQDADEFCEDVAPATGHENLEDGAMEAADSTDFLFFDPERHQCHSTYDIAGDIGLPH